MIYPCDVEPRQDHQIKRVTITPRINLRVASSEVITLTAVLEPDACGGFYMTLQYVAL
jgi:hypothetical protein